MEETDEIKFYSILNKGASMDGNITYAVLNGEIKFCPGGFDAYHGLEQAEEKLRSPEIQKRIEELGIEMEVVAVV